MLIANYNKGKYLEDAINSIMKQTYNCWEIILVDDRSTDNSADIYKKYEGLPNIHIYYNNTNHGCGYTKRRCAELANGEICGFLDSDDTLEPDALEIMVKTHQEDNSLSMVYSRYNEVDEDMQFIGVSKQQRNIPEGSSFLEGDGVISHFVTFKTSAYRKTPGINADFVRAVDHNMYFMLEEVGKVNFVDKVLYNYRTNTGKNISLGDNRGKAYLWHLIGAVDVCRRRGLPIEKVVLRFSEIGMDIWLILQEFRQLMR
ncbi:MAG: glycosyltransferase family A protein [Prevotella sp.]|nr:glycosyltransferase family A protein [Prevotella sp.]